MIAHTSVVDALVERITAAYRTLPIGNPSSDGTLVGPLIHERSYRDIAARRFRSFNNTRVQRELREIRVDFARLSDELSNITKFFGDWHLARIYQGVSTRFHLSDWHRTIDEKLKTLDETPFDWTADVPGVAVPSLVVVGDADAVRVESAVELFRLLGGGAMGDMAGLSKARLAILPGTTHFMPPGSGMLDRHELLMPILTGFLDEMTENS